MAKAKSKAKRTKQTSAGIRIPGSGVPRKPRSLTYCVVSALIGAFMFAWGCFCISLGDYIHAMTGGFAGVLLMLVAVREHKIYREAKQG